MSYLTNRNLTSKQQQAFMVKHSTNTNLLDCIHDQLIALEAGNSADVVYIDCSRAFDGIVDNKLIGYISCRVKESMVNC